MRYTRIPETAFQKLQLNAGILLAAFDPETGEAKESDMLAATSGGVNFTATPSFTDYGEDIDNAPVNVKELKKLDSWEITMAGSFITVDATTVQRLIGAADTDPTNPAHIIPRNDVSDRDFKDLWWVGDYSDKNGNTNGGFLAIHMMNSLSTGGFQMQSGNREKGQFEFEFTAHYSMAAQDTVPFEVYVSPGVEEPSTVATVPGQSETYLGKNVSEFVTEDTVILADGTVMGTLKYITDFTGFNSSEPSEQKGNYMPVKLNTIGKKMTLKKNGNAKPEKENMVFDPELLFRIGEPTDVFSIEVDGREVISLHFENATLSAE